MRKAAREAHLEHELQIAGLIQRSIQPPREPQIAGVDVAADWQPAATVGGDAWGWVAQPCGQLACFMVDVAGKGLPAALAAVSLHTAVRMALRLDFRAAEVLNIANDEFYDAYTNAGILATATVVTIDPMSGWVEHANAGHTPTLVCMDDEWQRWKATVPPLGVLPTLSISAHRVQLAPGDRLLLYSDGLSEIETTTGLWGDKGLEHAARGTTLAASAQSLISAVLAEAQALREGKPLHDDQTLVGIVYRGTL